MIVELTMNATDSGTTESNLGPNLDRHQPESCIDNHQLANHNKHGTLDNLPHDMEHRASGI